MFRSIWIASVRAQYFLRRYMPTNIALDAIRTRRGLKWGAPAMLMAVPYLLAAAALTTAIGSGGPGWLHLLVLLTAWNAMKFIIMGPVSVIELVRVKIGEWREGRAMRRSIEAIA